MSHSSALFSLPVALQFRRNRLKSALVSLCFVAAIIWISVFSGFAVGYFGAYGALVVIAAVLLVSAIIIPTPLFVLFIAVLHYYIVGNLDYFGSVSVARWIPMSMGFFLYVKIFADALRGGFGAGLRKGYPPFVWVLFLFLAFAVGTSVAAKISAVGFLLTLKSTTPFWGVMIILMYYRLDEKFLRAATYVTLFAALIQVPICVYQRFVVAARRAAVANAVDAWDAVVGSFGGNPEGGGASGSMAICLLIALTFFLCYQKETGQGVRRLAAVALATLATIMLAEVKVVFVLVPIVLFIVYLDEIKRSPAAFLGKLTIGAVAMGAVMLVYSQQASESATFKNETFSEQVDGMVDFVVRPDYFNYRTGDIGRTTAIYLWAQEIKNDPVRGLFGYGFGASRSRSFVEIGAVAKRYFPLAIDLTTASALLWDTGFVGFSLYCLVYFLSLRYCLREGRNALRSPRDRAILRATGISLLVLLMTLPYFRDAYDFPPLLFVVMVLLGTAGRAWLRGNAPLFPTEVRK